MCTELDTTIKSYKWQIKWNENCYGSKQKILNWTVHSYRWGCWTAHSHSIIDASSKWWSASSICPWGKRFLILIHDTHENQSIMKVNCSTGTTIPNSNCFRSRVVKMTNFKGKSEWIRMVVCFSSIDILLSNRRSALIKLIRNNLVTFQLHYCQFIKYEYEGMEREGPK